VYTLLLPFFLLGGFARAEEDSARARAPTHADAAIILAKYSGFFDRYVTTEADLDECLAFLNKTGIYFGWLEVLNGTEFTVEDCARSMGQIDLVLSGEAEFSMGKVKLPKGIVSWMDFCIMNGVGYAEGHRAMLEIVNMKDAR
jgi:hypothetical protein